MKLRSMIHQSALIAVSLALILVPVAFAAAGDLDTSFSGDGRIIQSFGGLRHTAHDLAVQGDGKVVVVGERITLSGRDFAIARYNTDGTLDAAFSGDGIRIVNIGVIDQAKAVIIQKDGRIVIGGQTCNLSFSSCMVTLVRLNPNGSLDTTFSGDGKVTRLIGSGRSRFNDISLLVDKIVVAGSVHDGTSYNAAVLRFLSNGSPDTSFSGDGWMTFSYGGHEHLTSIHSRFGKSYVAGYSTSMDSTTSDFIVARLNDNGTLDRSFSGDGRIKTDLGGYDAANDLAITSAGAVIVVGSSGTSLGAARYMPDGTPDTAFSGDGLLTASLGFAVVDIMDVSAQSGMIVMVGSANNADALVVRLDDSGSLDTTFSTDGIVTTSWGSGSDIYNGIVSRNSRLYVAGISVSSSGVERFIVAAYLP